MERRLLVARAKLIAVDARPLATTMVSVKLGLTACMDFVNYQTWRWTFRVVQGHEMPA